MNNTSLIFILIQAKTKMTAHSIEISIRSQELIKKYWATCGLRRHKLPVSLSLDLETLLSWLNKDCITSPGISKKSLQKIESILAFLRAQLLQDLYFSMQGKEAYLNKKNKDSSETGTTKFILLTAAGILVVASQGFDGIATVLSVFSLSSTLIFGAACVFSFLSVVLFCGSDLVKVANLLGVKLKDDYKILDTYLLQLQYIKAIREKIDDYLLTDLPPNDLKQLAYIVFMLHKCFSSLTKDCKQFDEALNCEAMQTIKTAISGTSALLSFAGGFFAGQSVAFFVSGLLINSMIPAFWPVIIFSSIVGLAALSVYWYIERPGLNKLVSNWFGLNEESVEQLCDEDLIDEEERKLVTLQEKITSTIRMAHRINQLEEDLMVQVETTHDTIANRKASFTNYSFFQPSGSQQQNQEETKLDFSIR